MKRITRLIVVIPLLIIGVQQTAYAFTDGSSAQLVKLLAVVKEQLQEIKKQVDSLKATNDELVELKENAQALYEDVQYIKEYSLDSEIEGIKRSANNVFVLDNWDKTDDEGKYLLLRRQINERIEPGSRSDLKSIDGRIQEIERIEALRIKLIDQAARASSGDINTGTADTTAAVATALIAANALDQQRKDEIEKLRREYNARQAYKNDNEFVDWLTGQ